MAPLHGLLPVYSRFVAGTWFILTGLQFIQLWLDGFTAFSLLGHLERIAQWDPGQFAPWNFRSLKLSLPGLLAPWNFRSLELGFPLVGVPASLMPENHAGTPNFGITRKNE